MVLDTSALVAFLRGEQEADAIERVLEAADELHISAFTLLEARVVLGTRFGDRAAADCELLLAKLGATVEPFDAAQAEHAYQAYRRFGRGTGHPARLNLGDCVSYALSMSLGLPLLFKGDDFVHTDVEGVL